MRKYGRAPPCLPWKPMPPFVGSVASGLDSHGWIGVPSGFVFALV